jgi:hypothetical protein
LALVVAGSGAALVMSPPVWPDPRAGPGAAGFDDQDGEQPTDLVAGQRDQSCGCGSVGVLVHAERGVGAVMASRVQRCQEVQRPT